MQRRMDAQRAVLGSKNDAKAEARFAARLDVLMERVDTLATTVAATASAMAHKDGEIAGLRRDLEARDQTLAALAARVQSGGSSTGERELRELHEAVAALKAERSKHGSSKQVDELAAKTNLLGQRLEALSETVSTTAAGLAGREGELASIRKQLEERDAEHQAPADELRAMLTTLRSRVEALDGLRAGVTAAELDERLAETSEAVAGLAKRIDVLAESVEAATTGLGDREHELAALHRHFLESSARVETIVEDLREVLGALPDTGPDALATLRSRIETTAADVTSVTSRLEQLEGARLEDRAGDLGERIERLEGRVTSLADEISRAKTLWPVALRSLEARLDDIARRPSERTPVASRAGDDPDDLLAGLRDSLQAMESVAAELERTTEAPSEKEPDRAEEPVGTDDDDEPREPAEAEEAVAGGARIVPLRQSDP
jgi:chromosome segregation ATPase